MKTRPLTKRTSSLDFLHPLVRRAAMDTVDELARSDVSFRLFETYRTPERQKFMRAKKKKVTNAGPWQSMHQYGLAVDFVINVKGVGPWTKKDGYREWWDLLHLAGERHGLMPLRNWRGKLLELPHMQLTGYKWRDCRAGKWPEGGDDPWIWNLHEAAFRYPKGAPKILPDYPEDVLECRPPLY